MKKFYVTTPIYYINDLPHIGHTYTTIIADILARYYKNLGIKTYFLTGTDEHATKIFDIAKKLNIEPKEYCNNMVPKWKDTWKSLDINYNRFIRTTDDDHIKTVQRIITILYENGDIYKSNYEGLYCTSCEKFISKEDLIDNKCPDHNLEPVIYKEENYFFKLSKYKDKIFNEIESDGLKIIPETRKNEILGKLELKLDDISISRKKTGWGITLPFDKEQTIYVWIDALINYLTGINYYNFNDENLIDFWPADLHLMAKDILWFHSVIWPGLLFALNIPLPKKLYVHGFFTVNGKKMSKTIGNVIKPQELINIFGVEPTRLLVISNIVSGLDGDFSISSLKETYNQLLANNFGNLISRTFAMIEKYFSNRLKIKNISNECAQKIFHYTKEYTTSVENIEMNKMVENALKISDLANKFIQEKSPWVLAKNSQFEELKQVLSDLLYYIKSTSLLLYPIMPKTIYKIFSYFNETQNIDVDFKKLILENKISFQTENFNHAEILFKKI